MSGGLTLNHPRFELRAHIGRGGMGAVFEALDKQQDRVVALKLLSNVDPTGILLFKKEFRGLADVEHPNLVRLGELFNAGDAWFFTMDLIQGEDFLAYVCPAQPSERVITPSSYASTMRAAPDALGGPGAADTPGGAPVGAVARPGLDERKLRSALRQLATGVSALHAAGKIHRDLKPSNVLVNKSGQVIILDFGLAMDLADHDHNNSAIVGTALYMAPEQAARHGVGPPADWYAFGAMLYEALTGAPPHIGNSWRQVLMSKMRTAPVPPRQRNPDVAEDLDRLCVELLRFDIAQRPSGAQILERLGGTVARPPTSSLQQSSSALQFVGRDREIGEMMASFDRVLAGEAQTIILQGESGVGKTALCRHFLDRVRAAQKTMVLRGRCYEREQVPYKAFDGVVDELARQLSTWNDVESVLPEDAALVARIFPVLRRLPAVPASEPRIPNPVEARTRAFEALRELITRVARRVTLAIHIDDFQWADAESVALMRELMHPRLAPPVLLLVTMRPPAADGPDLSPSFYAPLLLPIGGLSAEEAGRLAVAALGTDSAAALQIARDTKGHPLFVLEMVRYAQETGNTTVVANLDEALWARITRLEAPARQLLEVFAVAGSPLQQRTAMIAAQVGGEQAARLLSLLKATNLLRTSPRLDADAIETYHDRVRETLLQHLSADALPRIHAALAGALEATGEGRRDPRVLVRHLVGAGERARASTLAEEAARRASDELAFGQAADLYRTALELGQHDAAARRRLLGLQGDALADAGRCPEAGEAYLGSLEGADAGWSTEYRRRAAESFLAAGLVDRGMDELREVLNTVGITLPSTARRALMAALWGRVRLRMRGLAWTETPPSKIALGVQQKLEVYRAISLHLSIIDNVRSVSCQAEGLLLALKSGDRVHVARSLAMEAIFRANEGPKRRKEVEELVAESRRVLDEAPDPLLRGWSHALDGIVRYSFGDLTKAIPSLLAAETLFRDAARLARFEITGTRIYIISTQYLQGQYTALRERLDGYLRDSASRGDVLGETTYTRSALSTWLAADRVAEARERLGALRWTSPKTGFVDFQQYFQVIAEAHIAIYEGSAAEHIDALLPRLREVEGAPLMYHQLARCWMLWTIGRIALAASGERDHLPLARRMAKKLVKENVGYATVWGLMLEAGLHERAGHSAPLVATLDDAVTLAERHELPFYAAVARRRAGALRGGDEGRAAVERADAWMIDSGIVRPERMSAFIAP